ncbi:maltose O-acetyltransferase [Crossiella equi]|uniref:Maltose O-acetyltransferase n=1 Tax=Crossiella equi TaxID=130796 RepID=A0ABS5APY5_9PSEU|nr:sugar O-acetyltransferase [Crossiella equi]MBP2478623.1 maltose O-acetyltransferase [Crossiella equi]
MSVDAFDVVRAHMVPGVPYVSTAPEITPHRVRCLELLDEVNNTALTDHDLRYKLLTELLGGIGEDSWVMPRFLCEFGRFITLGDRVRVNFDVVMLDCAPITIGNDVWIAPRCGLYTANHALDRKRRREMVEFAEPITIGDDVWLGAGVTVLPGVTIGEGTVVGAGSTVVHDLPPGVLAVGSPARPVREVP